MAEEEDRAPIVITKVIASVLPIALKLGVVYLKYKRKVKKRERYLRKELRKAGMDKEHIDDLCEDMDTITIRDFLSSSGIPIGKDLGKIFG